MPEIMIHVDTFYREDWQARVSIARFTHDGLRYHTPQMKTEQEALDMAMVDLVRRTSRIAQ
jgi:hypothetical protein